MQEFFDFGVFITDYAKNLFDQMDSYNVAMPEEKERLRSLYEEITSKAVYSRRGESVNGEGTCYYYSTFEMWKEMKEKKEIWWSDVLSATVGND